MRLFTELTNGERVAVRYFRRSGFTEIQSVQDAKNNELVLPEEELEKLHFKIEEHLGFVDPKRL